MSNGDHHHHHHNQNNFHLPPNHWVADENARHGLPVPAPDFATGLGPKSMMISQSPEPGIRPNLRGRLVTGFDAHTDPSWEIIPLLGLDYDALSPENKKLFLSLKAHQQYQPQVLDHIRNADKYPDVPPEREVLDTLCRPVPSKDPKKQWACPMKGCSKGGDTREHIRTHLLGLNHFKYRFFICSTCKTRFVQKHDMVRHIKRKHSGVTQNNHDNDVDDDQESSEQVGPSSVIDNYFAQQQGQPIPSNGVNSDDQYQQNGPVVQPHQLGAGFLGNMVAYTQGPVNTVPASSIPNGNGYNPYSNPDAPPLVYSRSHGSVSTTTTNVASTYNSQGGFGVEQRPPINYPSTSRPQSQTQQYATYHGNQPQWSVRIPRDTSKGARAFQPYPKQKSTQRPPAKL